MTFFFVLNLQHLNKRPLGLAIFVLWFICWCQKIAPCSRSAFLPCVLIQLLVSVLLLRNPPSRAESTTLSSFPPTLQILAPIKTSQEDSVSLTLLGRREGTSRCSSAYSCSSTDWNLRHINFPSVPTHLCLYCFSGNLPLQKPWSCLCTPLVFYKRYRL